MHSRSYALSEAQIQAFETEPVLNSNTRPAAQHDSYGTLRRDMLNSYQRAYRVVAEIPFGRVATYGQVAALSGLGRRARLVGYALHHSPGHLTLPWHRVINAQGRISFPPNSEAYGRQRALLEAEGVVFVRDRVDLACYRWHPLPAFPDLD